MVRNSQENESQVNLVEMAGAGTLYMIKFVKEDSRREMYYVGKTKRFRRRMEEHVEGRGATWIKKNFTQAERQDCGTTKIREVDQNINA